VICVFLKLFISSFFRKFSNYNQILWFMGMEMYSPVESGHWVFRDSFLERIELKGFAATKLKIHVHTSM
jgi:hypothetical protein